MVKKDAVSLQDLVGKPVISLDVRDPVGTHLNHACRDAGVGLQSSVTVQTYHAALALAHHGLGIALVDSCTAVSADPSKVAVLPLEPSVAVPIRSLRPLQRPSSLLAMAMSRCVQQALAQTQAAQ